MISELVKLEDQNRKIKVIDLCIEKCLIGLMNFFQPGYFIIISKEAFKIIFSIVHFKKLNLKLNLALFYLWKMIC